MTEQKNTPSNENAIVEDIAEKVCRIELNFTMLHHFVTMKLAPKLDEIYYHVFPERFERDKRIDAQLRELDEAAASHPSATFDELVSIVAAKSDPGTPR